MRFIENMIERISPEWAYKREAWRQGLDGMRNYDAGSHDRINSNWRVINQSADVTDRYDRDTVRARARDLERNSDMMNAVIGAYKRNVIGGGYTLQARTADTELNNILEETWKLWCKKKNCDVTATQSFNQIIRMAVERKKVDGGILIVKRYVDGDFLPFKLQIFETDELDTTQMIPKDKSNKVVGGIEYNAYNRAQGYYIRQYSIDGLTIMDPIYIKAEDVIFYFTKKRPSQLREMSDMSPTITRIRDTNEFMVAVSVKERILACLSVFIKKAIQSGGIGRSTTVSTSQSYEGKTLMPGMIKELNAGDEVQVVSPSGQATDSTSYIKLQQRLVGAGQGLSYEAVARDMSETNYSSARQGAIEDELTYTEEIELLEEVMDEIYEEFVKACVLAGVINIKDFWSNKDLYFKHEWIRVPKKWIDPLKEANANRIALQTGQKTFKQIAAENGKDWKEQLEEMAEVNSYGEELGLDVGGVIYGQNKSKV